MLKKAFTILATIGFTFTASYAQHSIANVNPLTGAASVVIPVYSFSVGQVSFPINLVNRGNGVKIKDVEGTAGIGWYIQTGGQVSRLLRGLPDDVSMDAASNTRLGWMKSTNTANSLISSFSIANNGSTCSNETSDISYISSNFPVTLDTEPDIFYVNAPGLSCQLIYDKSIPAFRPISHEDIKITYTLDMSGLITAFTITNDKGIQYEFAAPELVTLITTGSSPSYFTTKYLQYQNSIQYYDNWHLTSIIDPQGNGVVLSYTTGSQRASKDEVALYIAGSTTKSVQYTITQYAAPKTLHFVSTTDGDLVTAALTFTWTSSALSGGGTDQTYVSSITGMGKSLQFTYSPVKYVTSGGANYYRQFLRTFVDGTDPNSPINYLFRYYGETGASTYTTTLPDSSSYKVDYWGYYASGSNTSLLPKVWVNPSNSSYQRYQVYQSSSGGSNYTYALTGNTMNVDTANVKAGSLQWIQYAQGGRTTINYESNTFVDPQTGTVLPGGGIRVQSIVDDPDYGQPYMVRSYSYNAPSTSATSGKPVSLPAYAFTIPYNGSATGSSLWAACTALSTSDLSNEDHTIMYEYFKVKQTGAGSTVYHYYLPATNWDNSATPGCTSCTTADWSPVINLVGRNNCSSSYGQVKNDIYAYPFIPNTNYDFERGLLQKVTKYLDDDVTEVSESTYSYQRSFSPTAIAGFRYDTNVNSALGLTVTAYNTYTTYCSTGELTTTVTNKVYDSNAYTQSQSNTVTYTYGSSNHKLPTEQSTTNSDGVTYTTKTVYAKDYTSAGAGTNQNVNAIYQLQQLNINIPIETYQQVTKSSTTKTTGGSLTLFKDFTCGGGTFYLPSQQLKFVEPDGLSSFTPYSATGSGSSQSSTSDSHYYPVQNFTAYDYSGYLQTSDNNNHQVNGIVVDHTTFKPVLSIKNAAAGEVGFADFDTGQNQNFVITGSGSYSPTGSHAGNAYGFATGRTLTATVSKNTNSSNYLFSIWINAASGSNTLYLSLNGGTATTYTFTGTGSWKYYEWKVPVSSMPSSFSIAVTTAQNMSVDDLLFYPEVAEVSTATYDATTYFKIAQTNTNGISTYFTYDQWGRVLYIRDQDHNIVQRNSYVIPDGF